MPTTRNPIHELKIGPFSGGINQYSDISAIADTEMTDCVNFDIDLDGSLKSRPPWRLLFGESATNTTAGRVGTAFNLFLGSYTYQGVQIVFYQSESETVSGTSYALESIYLNGPNAGMAGPFFAGRFSKTVRYNDFVYAVPDVTNADDNGIKVYLDGSVSPQLVPLKRGYSCVIYKDRLWISGRRGLAPESRLFFSDPGNVELFQSTSFFDINPGDGDAVQDLAVYQDNLVIFKDSATYVLTFDSNPAQAALQVVNTDVGVSGPRCVIAYENSIFVLQYNQVYEMINYDFTRVSVKIPFEYDATFPDLVAGYSWRDPIWLSRIGDRLVARFYNRLYVYQLRLRAWARWDSDDPAIKYLGYVGLVDNTNVTIRQGFSQYVAGSSLNTNPDTANSGMPVISMNQYFKLFILDDRYENTYTENGDFVPIPKDISCVIKTKAFDMGFSHRFKRMLHWGVDVITGRDITGTALPFSETYSSTWAQLANYHWHDLGSWQFPLFVIPTTTVFLQIGQGRIFVRFPKSLRFRLVQFEVDMLSAGNTTDGPARMYSITAFVVGKQLVPKAVN